MRKDLLLIFFLVMILALMAVPLSTGIIDVLLAANISLAVVMLMIAVYLKRPSDFSTFPSVILISTAFRLALSIGTTRLILSDADAGAIVETFGDFVVSGSIGIGLVIFLIITVVQFLVITKGAERVAEVGARFALDALPGKQMTIDAEVRAGNLTAEEGAFRRAQLDKDSQYFGAMDGAMKFVKGDAVAGLIIIFINLIGGVVVGMTLHGMSFGEAIGIFSLLTIGDGLVAQFPALLMSLCAGVMVTRVSNDEALDLGTDIIKELVDDPRVPGVAAAIILCVGFIPGFPIIAFGSIAFLLMVTAFLTRNSIQRQQADLAEAMEAEVDTSDPHLTKPESEDKNTLEYSRRFTLTLSKAAVDGISLTTLSEQLLDQFWTLYSLRGVRFPRAAIIEDPDRLDGMTFTVSLDEVPLANHELLPGHSLLRPFDLDTYQRVFPNVTVASFSSRVLDGFWVPDDQISQLEDLGISLASHEDIISFIAFRLYEHNIGTLFSNEVLNNLLASFAMVDPETTKAVQEEINQPGLMKMFRYLVEDGVPLRPAQLVISNLYYWIHNSDHPTPLVLAECLRAAMKRQLCYTIAKRAGVLGIALLDPEVELAIRRGLAEMNNLSEAQKTDGIYLNAENSDTLLDQFRMLEMDHKDGAYQITVVAAADIRRRLRNFLTTNDLHLPVLAPHEISADIPSYPIELIRLAPATADA